MSSSNIRVLIVDDSIMFREKLATELRKDPYIVVIGTATDVFDARDKILALEPDVLTLDVQMPRMDGIEFLNKLLPQYPIPVIVSSSDADRIFDAMDAGAVDFVPKPANAVEMEQYAREIIRKVKMAAGLKVDVARRAVRADRAMNAPRMTQVAPSGANKNMLIAVGASTGGTEAIFEVLTALPANIPGIVMVQHMPEGFTKLYSERLNRACAFTVKEAEDNDSVRPGLALLAPGGEKQMKVVKGAMGYAVKLLDGEKVSGHRPSVDFLFDSAADAAGDKAIGVILTGMGADGAKGLLKMRNAGAYTIGQDEQSCVVYGMPMAAFTIGAVMKQLSLSHISQEICGRLALTERTGAKRRV